MGGGWSTQIDVYCERVGTAFWAEPVNAVTNAAFLLAAGLVAWRLPRDHRRDPGVLILLALMVAIGIGSFLFHTVATRWAALADTLPIGVFILVYLVLTMRRGFGLRWSFALAIGVAFLPASAGIAAAAGALTGGALGGSSGYLPALLALVVCAGLLYRQSPAVARGLLLAAGIFVVSLTFRTLDGPLCQTVPLGTHFLWHVLNAAVLGVVVETLTRMRPASA